MRLFIPNPRKEHFRKVQKHNAEIQELKSRTDLNKDTARYYRVYIGVIAITLLVALGSLAIQLRQSALIEDLRKLIEKIG